MSEMSVLIVEDDEVAAEILQKFVTLKDPDSYVEWCWNGYEALVRIEELRPDVILLDYMMPNLDGKHFLSILKELEPSMDSRIVVVSAYVSKENEQMFYDMGADDVLAKPVSIDQINAVLEKAKQAKESRTKTGPATPP